jgi:hypothetical protein
MNEIEKYEFDRQGYLVLPGLLSSAQAADLLLVVDQLEAHAAVHVKTDPAKPNGWKVDTHRNMEKGYHAYGSNEEGETLVIEDFWNADPAFDFLMDHPRTMEYVRAAVRGRQTINNSEIRIRYKGNSTQSHGSGAGALNHKYRYNCDGNGIDCMMVRMVYFLQDVSNEQGAFSVVPATHKSCIEPPYDNQSDTEPNMLGLQVKAGDGIFFTEALRHGGLTNHSDQVRKTLHVGYGPNWMMSQNIATMDEPQHVTDETWTRLTVERRDLFRPYPEPAD